MGSGAPMSPAEGESYHLALARVAVAATLEDVRAIAHLALRAYRAGPPAPAAHGSVCLRCGEFWARCNNTPAHVYHLCIVPEVPK